MLNNPPVDSGLRTRFFLVRVCKISRSRGECSGERGEGGGGGGGGSFEEPKSPSLSVAGRRLGTTASATSGSPVREDKF